MKVSAFALGLLLSVSGQGFASDVVEEGGSPFQKTYTSDQVISALCPELWIIVSGYLDEGSKVNFVTAICEKDVKLSDDSVNNLLAIKSHYTIKSAKDLEDFEAFPRPGLMELNFSRQTLDDDSFAKIVGAVRSNAVVSLDLSRTRLNTQRAKELAEALKENTTLQMLNLKWNGIGAAGAQWIAEALKENKTVQTLNLGSHEIGAEGARAIAAALEENRTLKELNLRWTQIGDAGAGAIADALLKNQSLQTLSLEGNGIGDAGAQWIAAALAKNTTLQMLNLKGNYIDDAGARALAAALLKNTTLQTLDLCGNGINPEGRAALEALKVTHPHLKIEF